MDVETATAAGHGDHNEHTYYFCGLRFDLNPEPYLGRSAASPKSRC
jgi:YHS domain-containing protein